MRRVYWRVEGLRSPVIVTMRGRRASEETIRRTVTIEASLRTLDEVIPGGGDS
jgi:hypothetical protein